MPYKDKAKQVAQHKRWREEHKEELRKQKAEYYLKNRERIKERDSTLEKLAHRRERHLLNKDADNQKKMFWWHLHKSRNLEHMREYRESLKAEVLAHYGNGKCACIHCGFSDMRALSLDHISGDGAVHRKRIGIGGYMLYFRLRKEKYPLGFQTLCMNCQFIKRVVKGEYSRSKQLVLE